MGTGDGRDSPCLVHYVVGDARCHVVSIVITTDHDRLSEILTVGKQLLPTINTTIGVSITQGFLIVQYYYIKRGPKENTQGQKRLSTKIITVT